MVHKSPAPGRCCCLLPPQCTVLVWSCLNTGVVFSSCPRKGQNWKGQGYWPRGDIYHETQLGSISAPVDSSRCLEGRRGCSSPRPAPVSCSPLHSTNAHWAAQWGKKGEEAEILQGLLFFSTVQAQALIKRQCRTSSPPPQCCHPAALLQPCTSQLRLLCSDACGHISADLTPQMGLMPINIGIF